MLDQAHDLRQLATRCKPAESPRGDRRPALVVVAGGKGGVGTTTVAIGLAASVAKTGKRAVLIDADPRGGDVGLLCGVEERYTIADVLNGRSDWNETLCVGPAGIGVVVGQRGWQDGRSPAVAAEHLIEQLAQQELPAELAVIDAGNRLDGVALHLCGQSDALVMVTTGDVASVVGAFAAVKSLLGFCGDDHRPAMYLLVNMARSARVAEIVYYRLARTCRRVLGVELRSAGRLPRSKREGRNSWGSTNRLNLQVALADTLRGVSAVDVLSS